MSEPILPPGPLPRARDTHCQACGSERVHFDPVFGFYQCLDCTDCWAYPEDDPDLDEAAEAAQVMEQVYEVNPRHWAALKEGIPYQEEFPEDRVAEETNGGFDDC